LRERNQFAHVATETEQADAVLQSEPINQSPDAGFERSVSYNIEAPGEILQSCQGVYYRGRVFRRLHARDHQELGWIDACVTLQRGRDIPHAVMNHRQPSGSGDPAA